MWRCISVKSAELVVPITESTLHRQLDTQIDESTGIGVSSSSERALSVAGRYVGLADALYVRSPLSLARRLLFPSLPLTQSILQNCGKPLHPRLHHRNAIPREGKTYGELPFQLRVRVDRRTVFSFDVPVDGNRLGIM